MSHVFAAGSVLSWQKHTTAIVGVRGARLN
jgi:hypothetical protein